jgi:hypothetical protein
MAWLPPFPFVQTERTAFNAHADDVTYVVVATEGSWLATRGARTRQRHADVQRFIAEALTMSGISRWLGLDRTTVRRFARTLDVDEFLVAATHRKSLLDGYTEHLHARLAAGVDNAAVLHAEIRALGNTGSVQTVRRFVHPRRHGHEPGHPRTHHGPVGPPAPAVHKPRQISRWIMTDPTRLDPDNATRLDEIIMESGDVARVAGSPHTAPFDRRIRWKTRHAAAWASGRPFIWVDDEITGLADRILLEWRSRVTAPRCRHGPDQRAGGAAAAAWPG